MITNSITETFDSTMITATWDLTMSSKSVDELKQKIGAADLVKHVTWLKQKDVSITATTPLDPFTAIPVTDEINIAIRVYGEFSKDFKKDNNPWVKFVNQWFFAGADAKRLVEKENIDRQMALNHLRVIMGSFEPKHEHKIASVAYLLSQWFDFSK